MTDPINVERLVKTAIQQIVRFFATAARGQTTHQWASQRQARTDAAATKSYPRSCSINRKLYSDLVVALMAVTPSHTVCRSTRIHGLPSTAATTLTPVQHIHDMNEK